MEEELKQLIQKIKNSLKKLDNYGITHPELNTIYDYCEEMEDVIYYREEDDLEGLDLRDDDE